METGLGEKARGSSLETKDLDKLMAMPSAWKNLSPCHEYQLILCKKVEIHLQQRGVAQWRKVWDAIMHIIGPVLSPPSWHFFSNYAQHQNHWGKVWPAFIHKKRYKIGIDFDGSMEKLIWGWVKIWTWDKNWWRPRETALSENPSSPAAFVHKCKPQTAFLHFDRADFVEMYPLSFL